MHNSVGSCIIMVFLIAYKISATGNISLFQVHSGKRLRKVVVWHYYIKFAYRRNEALWAKKMIQPAKLVDNVKTDVYWRVSNILPSKICNRDTEWFEQLIYRLNDLFCFSSCCILYSLYCCSL